MNQRTLFISGFLLILAVSVYYAPSYLIVSDTPVKSDAVVLFLGGEKGTREKEANQLVMEGYADYLIIPARKQVAKLNPDGKLIKIDNALTLNHLKLKTARSASNQRTRFMEDTHEEALIARDMMERLGIQSAIFVSSPYHMRRIKVIAEKVFGDNIELRYVPSRYETTSEGLWFFKSYERKFILTEYAKITWFLLYNPLV